MRLWMFACLSVLVLAACENDFSNNNSASVAQFWRPISEPNIEMQPDKLQRKLDFDLSQCHCGIYPTNTPRSEGVMPGRSTFVESEKSASTPRRP